jgi:hypothetical protein
MNLIEKEIQAGVVFFACQFNVNITPSQMVTFMNLVRENRKIKLCQNTFLQVCQFLRMSDIVSFIATCKEYHIYEQYVWGIIQADYFPASLISKLDYKHIRSKMALEYYYFLKKKYNGLLLQEKEIAEDEGYMVKRYDELKKMNNSLNDIQVNSIKQELKALRNTRTASLAKIPVSDDRYRLLNLTQCSIMDPTGVPYLTIKQDMDMAIYGLDENDPYEKKIGIENNKWVTGEYNERIEYNYDSDDETSESDTDIFEYNDPWEYRYRIRIKPQYIKDIENQGAKKCSCTDGEFYPTAP